MDFESKKGSQLFFKEMMKRAATPFAHLLSRTSKYGIGKLVDDIYQLRNVPGIETVVNKLAGQVGTGNYHFMTGYLYEIIVSARFARQGKNVTFIEKAVAATTDAARTDIDTIADGVYYQLKYTGDDVLELSETNLRAWIEKAVEDGASTIQYVSNKPFSPDTLAHYQKLVNEYASEHVILRLPTVEAFF